MRRLRCENPQHNDYQPLTRLDQQASSRELLRRRHCRLLSVREARAAEDCSVQNGRGVRAQHAYKPAPLLRANGVAPQIVFLQASVSLSRIRRRMR